MKTKRMKRSTMKRWVYAIEKLRCPSCRRYGLWLASGRRVDVKVQCERCGWYGSPEGAVVS